MTLTHFRGVQLVHHDEANVTSRMPTPYDERVFGTPGVSLRPDRQRYQSRVADGQADQNRPKFGTQVCRIIVRSKDGLPMFPQRHQIIVRLASQGFKVDVLDERLSARYSAKSGSLETNLVNPCRTLRITVNLGPKPADNPQLARIRGGMDIKTLDILVRALPPVL